MIFIKMWIVKNGFLVFGLSTLTKNGEDIKE